MHKTAAWPLTLVYLGLIVYASLYPFADWRDQGIVPWAFLGAPLPRYWSGFDVAINVVGYIPFGGLLALILLRTGRTRHAVITPIALGFMLALCMEALQSYLPARVASREDLLLDTLGTAVGAVSALVLERLGVIDRWSRIRARWFVSQSRGGMVLLVLWPVALLFPPAVPFGVGHVIERLEERLGEMLQGTPFLDWLPLRDTELQPLAPGAELLCVALGVLIPCLLGYCVVRAPMRRLALLLIVGVSGVAASALSAALSWGPEHTWAWLGLPAQLGMVLALALALALALVPWRVSAAVLLVSLGLYLSLLNQAPQNPYFSQTLQAWEQGRFIRFHGLAQWLGWVWPYAAMAYVLVLLGKSGEK